MALLSSIPHTLPDVEPGFYQANFAMPLFAIDSSLRQELAPLGDALRLDLHTYGWQLRCLTG